VIVRALESVGRAVIRFLEEHGRFFGMLGRILAWAPRPPYDVGEWARQMVRVGVDSIPRVLLTTLFTGMVLALQTYSGFARFNAQSLVGAVVALSLTGRYYFTPAIFLMGGWDDLLNTKASRDSFFVGAGIRWGDDDMKYLAGSIPTR